MDVTGFLNEGSEAPLVAEADGAPELLRPGIACHEPQQMDMLQVLPFPFPPPLVLPSPLSSASRSDLPGKGWPATATAGA